jgi:hypothetical protein
VYNGTVINSTGSAKSYDVTLYLAKLLYGEKVAEGRSLVIDWQLNNIKHIRKNG